MSIVVDALVAGAAAGGKDVATAAVKDSYVRFKELLTGRLAARPQATTALAEVEALASETVSSEATADELAQTGSLWRAVLEAELVVTDAATAEEVLAAANELLDLLRRTGARTPPKYNVVALDGQGVQVGDHNTQTNTFGNSPRAPVARRNASE